MAFLPSPAVAAASMGCGRRERLAASTVVFRPTSRSPAMSTQPVKSTTTRAPAVSADTAAAAVAPTTNADPRLAHFPGATFLHRDPDILYIPDFLPPDMLAALIDGHKAIVASTPAPEASLYLNAAVNADVAAAGTSATTAALTAAEALDERELPATAPAGLRVGVPTDVVRELAPTWLPAVGAPADASVLFDDSLVWKPRPGAVVVRDATTVHYREGEGVGPHVDGKDATVLVYLSDVPAGGATVFPRVGVSVKPVKGAALVYCSRVGLLHYAAAVGAGSEKWVMQLLVDTVPDAGPGGGGMVVDYATGQVTYI
ncbi:hypothetical protein MMPV_006779 [Pyropia vietnamensis]